MIPIKTINKKIYCITGPTKENYTNTRITRIQLPSPEYKEWVWNKLYEIDISDDAVWNELKANCKADKWGWLKVKDILAYLSKTYFNNKQIELRVDGNNRFQEEICQGFHTDKAFRVFVIEEKQKVTKITDEEKEKWAIDKEREINKKLIKTFFEPTIQAIGKEYGLKLGYYDDNNVQLYLNSKLIPNILIKLLKENVINKLNEYGLIADLDEDFIKTYYDGNILEDIPLLAYNRQGHIRIKKNKKTDERE